MRALVSILKSVFTPFSAFAFLIFGLLACFVSGAIEMYVLNELLDVPGLGIDSMNWSILVVLVLEGSKFTLHFYAAALDRQGLVIEDFDVKRSRKLIIGVKNALVVLSLVCSLICVVNVLYDNTDKKITEYLQKNAAYCDEKFTEGIQELEEKRRIRYEEEMLKYAWEKESIDRQEEALSKLESHIKDETYINRRQDLQEEAEAMRIQINQLNALYSQHSENAAEIAQTEYEENYGKLEEKYGDNGKERMKETDTEVLMEGDNPYLRSFLNAFTKTFCGTGYNRVTYFLCAIFIGLTVAVVLELCISISQMLLTIQVESFVKIIGEIPKIEKGKQIVHVAIWLLFSVLITTAAYCIASIIFRENIDAEAAIMAVATYVITILLLNALMPKDNEPKGVRKYLEDKHTKAKTLFEELSGAVSDWIIPAAISFVGYMLIGVAFRGEFVYGDMTGVAIAIGGAFSKVLKFERCDFTI